MSEEKIYTKDDMIKSRDNMHSALHYYLRVAFTIYLIEYKYMNEYEICAT